MALEHTFVLFFGVLLCDGCMGSPVLLTSINDRNITSSSVAGVAANGAPGPFNAEETTFKLISSATVELARCRAFCLDQLPYDVVERSQCWNHCARMSNQSHWKSVWPKFCGLEEGSNTICRPACQTVCAFFSHGNGWPPAITNPRLKPRFEFERDPKLGMDCATIEWEAPVISKNIMGAFRRLERWSPSYSRLVYVIFAKDYHNTWYLLGQTAENELKALPQNIVSKAYIRVLVVTKVGVVARKTVDLSRSVWCPRLPPNVLRKNPPKGSLWDAFKETPERILDMVVKWYNGNKLVQQEIQRELEKRNQLDIQNASTTSFPDASFQIASKAPQEVMPRTFLDNLQLYFEENLHIILGCLFTLLLVVAIAIFLYKCPWSRYCASQMSDLELQSSNVWDSKASSSPSLNNSFCDSNCGSNDYMDMSSPSFCYQVREPSRRLTQVSSISRFSRDSSLSRF